VDAHDPCDWIFSNVKLRLHFVFKDQDKDSDTDDGYVEAESQVKYTPSLDRPSEWQLPAALDDAKHAMSKFDEKLNVLIQAVPRS
jgi:hypothetical protein